MRMLIKVKKIKPSFSDERGTIADILVGENVQHAGIITSKAKTVRGNHYHKLSKQYNYVLSGKLEMTVSDATKANFKDETIVLEAGDFVTIPPMVVHTLKAIDDSTFLVFTSEARIGQSYENDTYRINTTRT
jgi:quercetin dioxygenase-like cupin family protein